MRGNPKARNFRITYVDGFAGSGKRYAKERASASLFPEIDRDDREYRLGSPYLAVQSEPGFDTYIFIEPNETYADQLEEVRVDHPEKADRIAIIREDANQFLPRWCQGLSRSDRAMVFLDPYGMEVNWSTLQALAKTQKVDVWILIPIGQAVLRLLTDKTPTGPWANALTRFFGTEDWKQYFYRSAPDQNLFGDDVEPVRDASFAKATEYMVSRLKSIFAGVLEAPVVLRNKNGTPLFLLCFAASNPIGAPTAVKIARDIAKGFKDGR